MTDEPLPQSEPAPRKLSLEDLQLEIEGMWSSTLLMDGEDAKVSYVRLEPPQAQALKQMSSLLVLLIPRKKELAALLSKK